MWLQCINKSMEFEHTSFFFCLNDASWLHEYNQYRKMHPTTHTCLVTQTLGVPVTSCPLQRSLPRQTASFPWEELWRSRPSCLHRGPSPLQAAQSLYCKAQCRPPPRPFPSSLHSLFTINSFPFYTLLFPPVSPFLDFCLVSSQSWTPHSLISAVNSVSVRRGLTSTLLLFCLSPLQIFP